MSKFFHPSYRKLSATTTTFFPERDLLAWLIISPWIEQNLGANLPDVTSNFCFLWGSPVNPWWTPWGQKERTGLLQRKKQSLSALLSADCHVEQVGPEAMEDQVWAGLPAQERAGSVPLSFWQGPLSFWFLSSFCLLSLYFTHPPKVLLNNTTHLCTWPDFTRSRASLMLSTAPHPPLPSHTSSSPLLFSLSLSFYFCLDLFLPFYFSPLPASKACLHHRHILSFWLSLFLSVSPLFSICGTLCLFSDFLLHSLFHMQQKD